MMMKRTDSAYTELSSSQGPHHSLSAAVLKTEVEQNLNKIICFTDRQEELTKEVTAAFERDDLQEAKKLLAKMKYFANLEDKLKNKKIPS